MNLIVDTFYARTPRMGINVTMTKIMKKENLMLQCLHGCEGLEGLYIAFHTSLRYLYTRPLAINMDIINTIMF